jgi:hypothetical protein
MRVQCVASTFDAEFAREARTLVQQLLPDIWTDRTLASAGAPYIEIARRTGDLRAGQLIFGTAPLGRLIPYGLWWPWENGQTISLRIGLERASPGELAELCAVFGAEP